MQVIKLNAKGVARVLDGKVGMTFIVDSLTTCIHAGPVAHVRDYRYQHASLGRDFQIWSIPREGYEVIA
jgi:hypothetical protein